MASQSFDADRYKASQQQDWDGAAAGWDRWDPVLERGAQPVSDRLIEWANVQPGHRVLDIATGTGEPAVTAAQKVGAGGRVVAIDQAPHMLDVARARAESLGLSNLEFRMSDAEVFEFSEDTYDTILCR